MQRHATIHRVILLRVLPPTILVLFGISYMVSQVAGKAVKRAVYEHTETQARHAVDVTSRKIQDLVNSITALASNSLVVSASIHVSLRKRYIRPFFRSLQLPGMAGAHMTMTDYKGNAIASNHRNPTSYHNAPWLQHVMAGKEHIELSSDGMLIAVPVKYGDLTEGMIAVEFGPNDVTTLLAIIPQTGAYAIADAAGTVLFSSDMQLSQVGRQLPSDDSTSWLQLRQDIPGPPSTDIAHRSAFSRRLWSAQAVATVSLVGHAVRAAGSNLRRHVDGSLRHPTSFRFRR